MLSTGLLTVAVVTCFLCVWASWHWAAEAREIAAELRDCRAKVDAADLSLQALWSQQKRLAGRVYADEQHGNRPKPNPAVTAELEAADAARDRDALRAELLPHTLGTVPKPKVT